MIPGQSDPATEMFHWQRYLFFRPWYEGRRLIDAASGEGYGAAYAAAFARNVRGFDVSEEAIAHASATYGHVEFVQADVCEADYSQADLVVSFETIEHLEDPLSFLRALNSCPGAIVISTPNRETHSPGAKKGDKPANEFHTVEWTPQEFARLVRKEFGDRTVRFLSQAARWPGTITEGLRDDAMYTLAVIDGPDLPVWPRLGLAMPTRHAERAVNAVTNLSKYYPGDIEFAVVANGCAPEHLQKLREAEREAPHLIHVVESETNLGYAVGANLGLDFLWQEAWFDLFGVVNDDVYPAVDCLPQMVEAYRELVALERKPGVLGPVSNCVNGAQQVDIGIYTDIQSMQTSAAAYHRQHHSSVTETDQVRGLLLLITPECLSAVGGFDPRFGLGNVEDDDHNLRCRLAGFSLWIVDGAFLHHTGSATFKDLGLDYQLSIARNGQLFAEKWRLGVLADWSELRRAPKGVKLFVPLTARAEASGFELVVNGETVDLVHQASDLEFTAWLVEQLRGKPRTERVPVIEAFARKLAA